MSQLKTFNNELNILPKLNHPSILQDTEQVKETLGNICETKKKELKTLGWTDSKRYIIIYGIASAMSYLHSHDIIHCNLNSDSIFLDSAFYPKIGGFEFSRQIPKEPSIASKCISSLGKSQEYLAPEVLLNRDYSKKSDVYSFALVAYEILSRKKSFEKLKTTFHLIKEVSIYRKRPDILDRKITRFYADLIQKCWAHDPCERPSFDEIVDLLKHNSELAKDEEYQNYINMIDNSQISYDQDKEFHEEKECSQKVENFVNNFQFDLKKFEQGDVIDSLLFNDVCLIDNKETGERYSARVSNVEISKFFPSDLLNFSQELAVISQLDHPSINKFIAYSPVDFQDNPNPVIVSNFCSSGNLYNLLKVSYSLPFWTDTHKLIVIYGIASGMSYLHLHNIIHRNLKPQNILLDEFLLPKIDGFQLSFEIPPDSTSKICSEIKGTPAYLSPEVYLKKEYSKSSDVYAFSLIVYQIMTNLKPFKKLKNVLQIQSEVVQKGKRPEITEDVPYCYKKLIEKCWSQDPKERPTFDEIVDILRNDSEFITEKVDLEEFQKYVKKIDEANVTFNPNKKIIFKEPTERKITSDVQFSLTNIFETEASNISLDFAYVDLNDFDKRKKISSGAFGTVYEVFNKKTGLKYAAKIFNE